MASPRSVVSKFMSSAITFTQPGNPKQAPGKPGQDPNQPSPDEKRLEQLKKKKEMLVKPIERQITQLQQKTQIQKQAADAQELFRQIRPLLSKLQIATMADGDKTELVEGKSQGKNSLYKVVLRRTAQLDDNVIERLKRNEENFESMQWSQQALEVYLWWPYTPPAEEQTEEGAPPPELTASYKGDSMELKQITEQIDKIASDIQEQDPSIALALDRISDQLERLAAAPDQIKELRDWLKKNLPPEKQKEGEKEVLQIFQPASGSWGGGFRPTTEVRDANEEK